MAKTQWHTDTSELEDRLGNLAERSPHFVRLIDDLVDRCVPDEELEGDDPLPRFQALNEFREILENTLRIEAQEMRRWWGKSWVEIGKAIGLTRQGANKRFQLPEDEDRELAHLQDMYEAEADEIRAQRDVERTRLGACTELAKGRPPSPDATNRNADVQAVLDALRGVAESRAQLLSKYMSDLEELESRRSQIDADTKQPTRK